MSRVRKRAEITEEHMLMERVLIATRAFMPLLPDYGVEAQGPWIKITREYGEQTYVHRFAWINCGAMAKHWLELRIKKEIEKITTPVPDSKYLMISVDDINQIQRGEWDE